MESLEQLNAEGKKAFAIASEHVDSGLYVHAVERYARAVDLEARIWAEWVDHGRPLMLEAPNGVRYAHPLLKMYRDASADAATASRAVLLDPSRVKNARPGRPLGSVSAPDRRLGPMVEVYDDAHSNRPGITVVARSEPPRVVKARKL